MKTEIKNKISMGLVELIKNNKNINISELAKKAGVNRSTIYYDYNKNHEKDFPKQFVTYILDDLYDSFINKITTDINNLLIINKNEKKMVLNDKSLLNIMDCLEKNPVGMLLTVDKYYYMISQKLINHIIICLKEELIANEIKNKTTEIICLATSLVSSIFQCFVWKDDLVKKTIASTLSNFIIQI